MHNESQVTPRNSGGGGGGGESVTPPPPSTDSSSGGSSGPTLIDNNLSDKKSGNKIGTRDKAMVDMKEYNFEGITITENPKMSFFEAQTQYATSSDGKNMSKKFSGVPKGMNKLPPSFYNSVQYPHRMEIRQQMNLGPGANAVASRALTRTVNMESRAFARSPISTGTTFGGDDSGYFRLGACEFKIPPEFITVSMTTGNTAIPIMRSASSLMTKHSYADREIMVNLVLNGMEQINGYRVDSPFGYPHYIDGLRALLGQFKYTPFVPVVNVFLNIQHNIHTVALTNITVETVEGFPETLSVTMTLKEFNATPYTQAPNCMFDECVIWDLFNFYIQRNIRDKETGLPLITTPNLTNKVKFKVLKAEVLKKLDGKTNREVNLLDDKNYNLMVDSDKLNLHMTKLTFAMGNRMPKLQMSYHETPTMQFMGGTDTQFIMQFETTNQSAIAAIQNMNSTNLSITRENKDKNSVGFIKVENELINLTGTSHIAINNITSSTVPGFPGLYTVSISGVSFDCGVKDREKFTAMRPFYTKSDNKESRMRGRKGTEKDLLSQTKRGLANKVIQEACIESKLMETELYPDLRLPKYSAVDWALSKIQGWRSARGLEALPFTRMPRPKSYIPGRGSNAVEYNGYVDPDFWLTYPFQAGDMNVQNLSDEQIASQYRANTKRAFGTDNGVINEEVRSMPEVRKNVLGGLMAGVMNPVLSLILPSPTVDKAVEPDYVPGYEPEQQIRFHWGNLERHNADDELIDKLNSWVRVSVTGGGGAGGEGAGYAGTGEPTDPTQNPKQVSKVTGNPFVDLLVNRAKSGCGYVFGASQNGDICTQSYINKKKAAFGAGIGGWGAASKWIGKQVWDCSSFVCWGLIQIGLKPKSFKITSGSWGASQGTQLPRNSSDLKVGDLCYGGGHIIVYMGNGDIVHASSHSNGCTFGKLSYWLKVNGDKCKKRCRVHGLEEACKKFLEKNPNFYLEDGNNKSSSSSSGSTESKDSNSSSNNSKSTKSANAKSLGVVSVRTPATDSGSSGSSSQGSSGDSFTSGEAVLGKFGKENMLVQQLNASKKEKSSKDSHNGLNCDRWDDIVVKHCKAHNLDPNFIKCIMMIESNGNPRSGLGTRDVGLINISPDEAGNIDRTDPDQNINASCKALLKLGRDPMVKFDKKNWISGFNRGMGALKAQLAGTRPETYITLNYYRKYDVFYARLVANGGKPGSTITALDNGKVPDASWYQGLDGGGGGTGGSSIDVKVWFEKDKPKEKQIDVEKLKNPNAGLLHSTVKMLINVAKIGLLGPGTVMIAGMLADAVDAFAPPKNEEKPKTLMKVSESKSIQNSYINNRPTVKALSYEDLTSNKPYMEERSLRAQRRPNDNPVTPDMEMPTQGEFGIGLVDSLSDGELNFNRKRVTDIEDFKNDKEVVERMFVDTNTYGQRGRLNRAFPSYMFMIIDEHQGWCDGKQFWSNYYLYQSVLDIDVHEAYDMPISTARVTLTNTNKNLKKYRKNSLTENIMNDDEISWINKKTYEWFGSIINEKVTQDMINMRNELYPDIFLREGFRIHIRLGYGSNPSNYAPTFSGTITEVMDNGDLISIAAQSDGAELVANVVSDRTNATNEDAGLPAEPSDIIAALLCDRQNEFLYQLTGGKVFIENSFGLMHFGFYSSGDKEYSPWTDGGLFRRDALEYDVIKNIYKSNYRGEYIYDYNKLWFFDGETNMRFFCYNKTPWDIMKMCEKMNPEFVAYPRPFGMEHRIFFGLPWWQHKFRYERDDANNKVYEMSKTFAQVNPMNSYQDIIENRMRIDTTKLTTNMIGVYTIGGDLASTPVVMSDCWIDRDKQTTKTIDTTSVQDFKGVPSIVDKAIEWSGGYDAGKSNAIKVCISELIDSWRNTYAGELIVIGAPEVRAWNYMYINDLYVNMNGVCQVREVVHSMSGDKGFVTTIVPGLIACNSMKQSGAPSIVKSILQVGKALDAYIIGYIAQSIAVNMIGNAIAGSKFATAVTTYGPKALSFIKSKGANILMWARNGEIFANIGSIISVAMATIERSAVGSFIMGGISSILTGLGITAAGATAVVTGGLAIVATFIVGALIKRLLTAISDLWKYDHVINVYPLYIENRPWIGGASGQRYLYPDEESEE